MFFFFLHRNWFTIKLWGNHCYSVPLQSSPMSRLYIGSRKETCESFDVGAPHKAQITNLGTIPFSPHFPSVP